MELKGSKTEQNLLTAFAGESQARNKYTFYASKARKDGYEQYAEIFEETANNEKEHAKMWFKELHDGNIPTTLENLEYAATSINDVINKTSTLQNSFIKKYKGKDTDSISGKYIFIIIIIIISIALSLLGITLKSIYYKKKNFGSLSNSVGRH